MSSLRNAIQRRNHKERAQPQEREKWGLLEKHKDYSLRAADFNAKKRRMKILKEKAADRNPDEFNFGMLRSHNRELGDRGNVALSNEVAKLLKTQDAGYLRTIIQRTGKQIEKLENEWVAEQEHKASALGVESGPDKHIVFVESQEKQRQFDAEDFFGTDKKGLERRFNRPRTGSQNQVREDADDDDEDDADKEAFEQGSFNSSNSRDLIKSDVKKHLVTDKKKRKLEVARKKAKLEALKERNATLIAAERELQLQRAKMTSSVGGTNKDGIKWKVRERKR